MQYLFNETGSNFYPRDPGPARHGRRRDLYLIGTLYPCWPAPPTGPRLPAVPRRGRLVERGRRGEGGRPEGRSRRAGRPARVSPPSSSTAALHRRRPSSIADIRLAASLEFLAAIDYDLPPGTEYMAAIEAELGDAYSEPAADVRGYIADVRAQ